MVGTECPSHEELQAYLSGGLSDLRAASLSEHLETCTHCTTALETLSSTGDPLLVALRRPPVQNVHEREPQVEQLIARAKALGTKPAAAQARGDGPDPATPPAGQPAEPPAFDPYYQWLGIPPKDQPPNHYRLLGAERFEENPDVIASAAEQRTTYLRTFQLGKYSGLSQRLLNEVAKAKVCLLNPATKAAYDATLKQQSPSAQAAAPSAPPAPPPPKAPPRNQLGEYQLLAKLGEGGMGTVYRARHIRLEKTVALKVLAKGSLVDAEAVARFDREMKAVGQLNHPNIVQAHDAREIAGTRFLAMEYVDGLNLAQLVDACGPLPVADACELIRQTALGLDHAHQHGLVHRDIKPSNLMLDSQGQVKILDLGLALFQPGQLSGAERITASGQTMGTIDYMAPEQALASRNVDIRADLYSLGCTLYKLLSGHAPFSGPKYQDVVNKLAAHAREPVRPIRKVRPDVPAELAAVLDRLLAKDPAGRFATPAEVAAAIAPLAGGSNLRALLARARNVPPRPAKPAAAPAAPAETLSDVASQAHSVTGHRLNLAGWVPPRFRTPGGLAVAAGGAAALVLLTVVILLRKDGKQTRIEAPDGSKVTISAQGDVDVTLPGKEGTEAQRHKGTEESVKLGSERSGQQAIVSPPLPPGEGRGEGASSTTSPILNPQSPAPPPAVAPFVEKTAKEHQEIWAKHLGLPVEMTNAIGMKLVLIPPGEFTMGEGPGAHRAQISQPFYLGKYPVTQQQWEAAMGNNPSRFNGPENPVENASRSDCQRFLAKLNAKAGAQGGRFSLPTEEQWEYACRAGSTTRYCFGDSDSELGDYAWYEANSALKTHPVGQKKPNAWGLCDMHGNVWQWCEDQRDADFYAALPAGDPSRPPGDQYRAGRGGAWCSPAGNCRSACNSGFTANDRCDRMGFRVCMVLTAPAATGGLSASVPSAAVNQPAAAAPPSGGTPSLIPNPQSPIPPPAVAPFDAAQAKQHQEAWAKYLGIPVEDTNSIGMKLTLIPPGEFEMGSTPEEIASALEWGKQAEYLLAYVPTEAPKHRVKITQPFYLGTYQVTQGEYERVMGVNPSRFTVKQMDPSAFNPPLSEGEARPDDVQKVAGTNTSRHPVETVSWDEAVEFCRKLSERPSERAARRAYRLPTEAEWEYACRAGTTTRWYCGDDQAGLDDVAWWGANAHWMTHPVGEKKPNGWGLHDMHGNTRQWCADWFSANYYTKSPPSDPTGPPAGSRRVNRGGFWAFGDCRSAFRISHEPAYRGHDLGLRVVVEVAAKGESGTGRAEGGATSATPIPSPQSPIPPPATPATAPGFRSGLPGLADLRYGLYITFDISTFVGYDNKTLLGRAAASAFAPKRVDVQQWARVAREAGLRVAVLTAKHEAGFCMWDCDGYGYSVAASPTHTDIVAAFITACHAEKILAGVHYSIPDARNEGRVMFRGPVSPAYFELIKSHVADLMKKHGDLDMVLFDVAKRLSPQQMGELEAIIKAANGACIVSRGDGMDCDCTSVNKGWFWKPDVVVTPADKLYAAYQKAVKSRRLFLVNVGPDREGRIPEEFITELMRLKDLAKFDEASLPPGAAPGSSSSAAGSTGAPATGVRYVGYTVYGPESVVDEIAPYTNVVLDHSWVDKGSTLAEKARKAGLTVVLEFGRKSSEGIDERLFPFIEQHRDAVAGVAWGSPFYHHYTSEQVEQFGKTLKAKFPRLQYWICNVEKPRGKNETQPIPPSVDVVVVDGYFNASPDGVRRKMDDCLPGWLAKAQGRPVLYRWCGWDWHAPGIVRKTTPGTMQACFEVAARHALSGVLFWKYGPGADAPNAGMDGIDANPALVKEIREAAGKLGIHPGETLEKIPGTVPATPGAAAGPSSSAAGSTGGQATGDTPSPAPNPQSPIPAPAVAPFDADHAKQHQEAWAKHLGVPVEQTNSLGMNFVLIPPGEFLMGSPDSDEHAENTEKPQHHVRITRPFYLGKCLVTQKQWQTVMGENPSQFKGPKSPVENVSWKDCQEFLDKLNAKLGAGAGKFQLPTEAQWEYACRAGSTTRYCFGDETSGLGKYAWHELNSGHKPHSVGEKKPNAWGLYDMHGNAWEWCADWYDRGYYVNSPLDDPAGPATGSNRVNRGGSWFYPAGCCRSASRYDSAPDARRDFLGLRVCMVLTDKQ
jgi:formylglycine-generating enzyme required for sulfatase activity/serine/threonine protein kinase